MIIFDIADRELHAILDFQSTGAASVELAAGLGDAHVHLVEIAAGGEIGPHVAGFGQLLVCMAGEGWAASADGIRVPLHLGQAAYFARGERHSKGSTTGLRALIVQVRDLNVSGDAPARVDDDAHTLEQSTTPTGIHVRPYAPRDHAEWLRMRRALWPEIPRETEVADAAEWLARSDTIVIVAARASEPRLAGFAELGARAYADGCDTSPVAYLEGWYVDDDVRRQGIGAALVRAGEAWARRRGFRELASDALLDNATSHRAHRALGFTEVERSVLYRKDL